MDARTKFHHERVAFLGREISQDKVNYVDFRGTFPNKSLTRQIFEITVSRKRAMVKQAYHRCRRYGQWQRRDKKRRPRKLRRIISIVITEQSGVRGDCGGDAVK